LDRAVGQRRLGQAPKCVCVSSSIETFHWGGDEGACSVPVVSVLKRSLIFLFRFSSRARTAMLVAFDSALCTFAALLAYSLRIGEWRIFTPIVVVLVMITLASWLVVAQLSGIYRSLLRFFGARAIRDLAVACGLLSAVLMLVIVIIPVNKGIPRTLSVLVPLILFICLAAARAMLSSLLRETLYSRRRTGRRRVLVYGAGVAGQALTMSINDDPEFQIAGFVDDNDVLRGRRLEGFSIWHSSELPEVLRRHSVDEILLAIPSASRARRRLIVDQVRELAPRVGVRSLPNLSEIASGRVSVSDLREIQIEELLGRDQVAPDPSLMSANILDRSVMVTGAGGSIGSELCRQILFYSPSRIVLAERSELALYLIDGEVRNLCERNGLQIDIQPKLIDVADRKDLERVFRECQPNTVFHAAAYKHVPLVETDPIAGIRNNIVGTHNCAVVGEEFGVQNFTLVSTDKAVRPSSVMGASKRVCELVVLARAAAQEITAYSAVRFGNVLGSSGSVVPLFRRQIAAGGPITLTDRDTTRYFMTVSEAAQLVVQAGAMAVGGEIFLLDMGEHVRIYDLAKMMVQLSGLATVSDDTRDGDIEIVEVGLRPGEKLHEELLIDNRALPTPHPRIVRANEPDSLSSGFGEQFEMLLRAIDGREVLSALAIVERLISVEPAAGTASATEAAPASPTEDGYSTLAKPVFGA
jgi:FlaA1/EpsC-like NDP-sugar epimerase